MAQTLVNGTSYSIVAGKTMVGGTVYDIGIGSGSGGGVFYEEVSTMNSQASGTAILTATIPSGTKYLSIFSAHVYAPDDSNYASKYGGLVFIDISSGTPKTIYNDSGSQGPGISVTLSGSTISVYGGISESTARTYYTWLSCIPG